MRTRYLLLAAAALGAGVVAAAPLGALADCSDSHMTVAKAEDPPKVTEPATLFVPGPDPTSLQAKAAAAPADRPAPTEAKPAAR